MRIESAQEALFIACEMERSAVQLYERALSVLTECNRQAEPLFESLAKMLADEKRHYRQFQSLYLGLQEPLERTLTLAAIAKGVLFEGGLMGAARAGLLNDVPSMLRYAQNQEDKAVQTYRAFAAQTQDDAVKGVLLSIAQEETRHWEDIRGQVGLICEN